MSRHRRRFRGAGASATDEFKRQRRDNIRANLHLWLLAAAITTTLAIWSVHANGLAGLFLAATAGAFIGAFYVLWSMGGHISAFHWWLGAEGERNTAKQIEKLPADWHCEHDLTHQHGNWDHILIGPAGVFLLDTKLTNTTAAAGNDQLRAGRLAYHGATFRGSALRIKTALEHHLGNRAPWVQALVVIWGDFPQQQHHDHHVTYLSGEQLLPWLTNQPAKLNPPQRAALREALTEIRTDLTPR
jgi:hypothetical protein